MPDVTRSDSSRSDVSRPRVSFNRNVHVKRINGPNTANAYSLSSDGTSLIPTSIRRERPRTKKEMNKEAEVVLKQVDKVSCKATTNVKLEEDKTKPNKKKSFSFLKKNDKPERAKYSSSDVDSGSSQEFRIYRINGPADENHVLHSSNTNKAHNDEGNTKNKNKINGKKSYDFMSLDRKRLKKEKKNKTLDYLSLEKNNEVLEKMKKKNSGKTLMSMVFEKMENKNKKATVSLSPAIFAEEKENIKSQIKISEGSEEKMGKKKQLSPIIESPGVDYFNRKRESNVDKMIKRLTEKTPSKLTRNTGKMGMKEQQNTICHNDNKPFSYTNGEKNDLGLKLESKNVEGLGDSKEDLKSTSPTGDVIYAQVIVGGRDGNAQQTTVYKRVASNEVGRVFVGEESNQFQVGSNYKTNANQDDGICERVSVISEDILKKENLEGFKMPSYELFADNRGHGESYHKKSSESDHASPNPARDEYTTVIKVAPKYDVNKASDKSPTDLHDLSIRREILLSRSESQAKERFNSIKRLQEPARTKRHVPNLNGVRQNEKPMKSEIKYVPDDTRVSEKNTTSIKKTPKEVEVTDSTLRKKRESKLDLYLKEKEEKWKNSDKVHVIKTDDYENILRKLSRLGKSKSFIQEKPKNKRMEKMKMLFKKKKESKSSESEEDPLAARYTEYRGSDIELSDRSTDSSPKRTIARTEAAPLVSTFSSFPKILFTK